MSVWPVAELVSISVHVEPRHLEALLDALAQVDFPINPQIYHEASMEVVCADGRIERRPAAAVEFPAYESRVDEVRRMLAAYDFPAGCVRVSDMLGEIQTHLVITH